jgi:beta-lactamase class A
LALTLSGPRSRDDTQVPVQAGIENTKSRGLIMLTRRTFCMSAGCTGAIAGFVLKTGLARADNALGALDPAFAAMEKKIGGRLGVAVLDTITGARAGHRSDERFPMCSTFKLLAVAAILKRVDAGQERLDRKIAFGPSDLVVNSPIMKARVGDGSLTLAEICEAAMVMSDNTAGNLLLANLGGPAGLTAFARSLGDQATRLDRWEPDLNEAVPGDPRDTTTPEAMLQNIRLLVLGDVLSASSRHQLAAWLLDNKTGDTRLRARLPKDWRVGDKTGAGERGTTNDVGLFWPTNRNPVIVSAYLTNSPASTEERNATIAAVGEAVANVLRS